MFIRVDLGASVHGDASLRARLAEVCPVDIFADEGGRLETVEANLDECTLCDLCVEAAGDLVRVVRLYAE